MEQFSKLTSAGLCTALAKLGIYKPTKIQESVIPPIKEGLDVIACSETGTGKTFAYLLPAFEAIKRDNKNPQFLALVPTRELAVQISRQCRLLNENLAEEERVEAAVFIGGGNLSRQLDALKLKPRIIIGSPGRILELAEIKKLSLHFIRTIALDEGDRLLKDNFIKDLLAVVKKTQKDRQLLLFSASIKPSDADRARRMMKEPRVIDARQGRVPQTIEHLYVVGELRDKIELLRKILHTPGVDKTLIFVNSPYHVKNVSDKLEFHGIKCAPVFGETNKLERARAMNDFRAGRINALVASDLVSRGLDIEGVTHVISLDFPENADDYVHRAGRCGRMGGKGVSVSVVTRNESEKLKKRAESLRIALSERCVEFGELKERSDISPNGA